MRRNGIIEDATTDTILQEGDIVAIAGPREVLVNLIGQNAEEVEDPELLDVKAEGVDVYVTSKDADGKTLAELSQMPAARGVFLRKIVRGATAVNIPILRDTVIHRGDIITIVGRTQDIAAVAKVVGHADRPSDVADVAFIGAAITLGALIGALVFKVGGVPLTLSTAGGALISGLVFGWLALGASRLRPHSQLDRLVHELRRPQHIHRRCRHLRRPGFVKGLQTQGVGLFLWGAFATTIPLILAMFAGKYMFRFDPAILLGACAGARTTTAALGMICETAKSQVPALGYTVTYAVGNTLLTIWGMVIIMLMT
jgi:putative transport protein